MLVLFEKGSYDLYYIKMYLVVNMIGILLKYIFKCYVLFQIDFVYRDKLDNQDLFLEDLFFKIQCM